MAELIGAVVLIVGAEDLAEHLEQVFIIFMDAELSRAIGLETGLQEFFKAKNMEEFVHHKKPAIGREFTSVKIYYKLLIAFKLDIL